MNTETYAYKLEMQIESLEKENAELRRVTEAIAFLRSEEADYLQICCSNPDPSKESDQEQVVCAGFWTMKYGEWCEIPFMGKTLIEALENAVSHRKAQTKAEGR